MVEGMHTDQISSKSQKSYWRMSHSINIFLGDFYSWNNYFYPSRPFKEMVAKLTYVLKKKEFLAFERMNSERIAWYLNGLPLLFSLISSKDFNK